jgi:hypothetical protein
MGGKHYSCGVNWLSSLEISRRIAVRRRLAHDLDRRKFLAERFQRAPDCLDDRTLDRAGALWFRPDSETEHHRSSGDIIDEHCGRRIVQRARRPCGDLDQPLPRLVEIDGGGHCDIDVDEAAGSIVRCKYKDENRRGASSRVS